MGDSMRIMKPEAALAAGSIRVGRRDSGTATGIADLLGL
jgi:hypothetical protein